MLAFSVSTYLDSSIVDFPRALHHSGFLVCFGTRNPIPGVIRRMEGPLSCRVMKDTNLRKKQHDIIAASIYFI